jgi:uncharacterized protein (DUF1330 family)
MPKGYVIARVTVKDPVIYAEYARLSTEAIKQYGGKPLIRGGRYEAVQGEARPRNVVLEFESYDRALEFYQSTEYAAAMAVRLPVSEGEFVVVEGAE